MSPRTQLLLLLLTYCLQKAHSLERLTQDRQQAQHSSALQQCMRTRTHSSLQQMGQVSVVPVGEGGSWGTGSFFGRTGDRCVTICSALTLCGAEC